MAQNSTATVTITGKIGPGNSLTSKVITGVTKFGFDPVNEQFFYYIVDAYNVISISSATTVTITLTGAAGNYTVSVS